MLHKTDLSRIQMKIYCPVDDDVISRGDTVKGFEYAPASTSSSPTRTSSRCRSRPSARSRSSSSPTRTSVDDGAVKFVKQAYYLEPDAIGRKAFYLLKDVLEDKGLTAICKVVIKDREALAAIDPFAKTMLLTTLHWPDEIRSLGELDLPAEEPEIKPAERKMAEQLIEAMTGEFDPAAYHDEYREALLQIIEAKVAGEETVAAPGGRAGHEPGRPDGGARGQRQGGRGRPRRERADPGRRGEVGKRDGQGRGRRGGRGRRAGDAAARRHARPAVARAPRPRPGGPGRADRMPLEQYRRKRDFAKTPEPAPAPPSRDGAQPRMAGGSSSSATGRPGSTTTSGSRSAASSSAGPSRAVRRSTRASGGWRSTSRTTRSSTSTSRASSREAVRRRRRHRLGLGHLGARGGDARPGRGDRQGRAQVPAPRREARRPVHDRAHLGPADRDPAVRGRRERAVAADPQARRGRGRRLGRRGPPGERQDRPDERRGQGRPRRVLDQPGADGRGGDRPVRRPSRRPGRRHSSSRCWRPCPTGRSTTPTGCSRSSGTATGSRRSSPDGKVRIYTRNGHDAATYFPRLLPPPRWLGRGGGDHRRRGRRARPGRPAGLLAAPGADLAVDRRPGPGAPRSAAAGRRRVARPRPPPATPKPRPAPLVYQVFDLLRHDGRSLLRVPLEERKRLLRAIVSDGSTVRFAAHVVGEGKAFYRAAEAQGLEGIVAKHRRSRYEPGRRTRAWLKLKLRPEQALVVGGWTPGEGNAKELGALVVGVMDDGRLRFAGKVGSGFDARARGASSASGSTRWPPTTRRSTRRPASGRTCAASTGSSRGSSSAPSSAAGAATGSSASRRSRASTTAATR